MPISPLNYTKGLVSVPELPEVETLRRGMERSLVDRFVVGVLIANPKVLKGQAETEFKERIVGQKIEQVDRRGKYLLVTLTPVSPVNPDTRDNTKPKQQAHCLCIHLKMRGQLRLQSANETASPYLCVTLLLDNNNIIRYDDMWTWGEMRVLTPAELATVTGLASLGPEPLTPHWSSEVLRSRLEKRHRAIKGVLLDQSVLAGVGNIYADEALFRAGIHPQRCAATLKPEELERLASAIQTILQEAVEQGGTRSEEFVDLSGNTGNYVPKVYNRKGLPCPQCHTILNRITVVGRGTVFCPSCQPLESSPTVAEKLSASA
jgi:formamidopyrimidine-DNA glycosylase